MWPRLHTVSEQSWFLVWIVFSLNFDVIRVFYLTIYMFSFNPTVLSIPELTMCSAVNRMLKFSYELTNKTWNMFDSWLRSYRRRPPGPFPSLLPASTLKVPSPTWTTQPWGQPCIYQPSCPSGNPAGEHTLMLSYPLFSLFYLLWPEWPKLSL